MPTYHLKRIEFIEVSADDPDQALEMIGEGLGEHVHETEELLIETVEGFMPVKD